MKASPEDQALLLDLQAFDTRLSQLAHSAKSVPQHAIAAEIATELAALRIQGSERSGNKEDVALELSRLESDVAVVEARIKRDTDRLEASSSVKDVAALEQELTALRKRRDDLEEIELTVMERLEEAESLVDETALATELLLARQTTVIAERDAALASLDAEREHVAANRTTVEGKVPAELLALYVKQRDRYGFGASHLRFGTSSANGVKLLENDLQSIRAAAPDDVIICPSSDAILVRTSESGL